MNIIYKYPFPIQDVVAMELPVGAMPLSIQVQDDEVVIWIMQNTQEYFKAVQKFYVFGTGLSFSVSSRMKHFTTIQHNGFVWHIFKYD